MNGLESAWPGWPGLLAAVSVVLLLISAYSYIGYPLVVRFLIPPRHGAPKTAEPDAWPMLTVLVAAYNEEAVIAAKIENLLDQDYPRDRVEVLVVSDASDDGTDGAVRRVDDPRVRFFRQSVRSGKTAGINRLGREARGEIFIQTDANVMFEKRALKALAAPFRDPDVGLVVGEVVFTNADAPEVAAGEGVYWRFEQWTKRIEALRGLLVVASGGIYAIRRSLWTELPENVDGDAVEPLLVARQGSRTVIAHEAIGFEPAAATLGEEFRRKSRIIARQVAGARWIRLRSLPLRILWAYMSHKLLRYAVPFMSLLAAALGLAALAGGSVVGGLCAAAVLVPLAVAPLGLLSWPRPLHRVFWIPLYLVVINASAVTGTLRGIRGYAPVAWSVPASTRPQGEIHGPANDGAASRAERLP